MPWQPEDYQKLTDLTDALIRIANALEFYMSHTFGIDWTEWNE